MNYCLNNMPRKASKKPKVREIKKKVKVKEIKDEEEEFDEDLEEISQEQSFVQHRASPRRLVSALKTPQKTLEQIPNAEDLPATTATSGAEGGVHYARKTENGNEPRFSYSSASGGKMETYVGKNKYHTTESSTSESRVSEDTHSRKAYAERDPFAESHEQRYDTSFASGIDSEKDKDKSREKKKRDMM